MSKADILVQLSLEHTGEYLGRRVDDLSQQLADLEKKRQLYQGIIKGAKDNIWPELYEYARAYLNYNLAMKAGTVLDNPHLGAEFLRTSELVAEKCPRPVVVLLNNRINHYVWGDNLV